MVRAARAPPARPLMLSVTAVKRRSGFALDVGFDMPTPGVVALFGRSGCGKTTLVHIIAGLVTPDAGRIALDDIVWLETAARINVPPERRGVGCVFQDSRLFPHLDVAANLRYGLKRAQRTRVVDLDTVVDLLGLASLMGRRTHQLSGGERQRVAIGRALLAQPRLLLLDEPLAALDTARRDEVLPYLETLRDRLALPMVYVTHRFDEVLRLATHLVLMQAGAVIAQGSLGEMSLDPNLRSIIGRDEVGAIIEGEVLGTDAMSLTRVRVGRGELKVQAPGLATGTALRVQLLARDIIVSTRPPGYLSVRNSLEGHVTQIQDDAGDSDLVTIDIGGTVIMARITKAATRELGLHTGMRTWALVKTVSLRGYSLTSPASPDA
jgi:molybdate transport system ATP-binding protein